MLERGCPSRSGRNFAKTLDHSNIFSKRNVLRLGQPRSNVWEHALKMRANKSALQNETFLFLQFAYFETQ